MAYYAIGRSLRFFSNGDREAQMPTRNVVLTKRQEKLVETLVESGRYQNASEVLRDGLRLVEQREAEDAVKLQALRQAARVGVCCIGSGRVQRIPKYREDGKPI